MSFRVRVSQVRGFSGTSAAAGSPDFGSAPATAIVTNSHNMLSRCNPTPAKFLNCSLLRIYLADNKYTLLQKLTRSRPRKTLSYASRVYTYSGQRPGSRNPGSNSGVMPRPELERQYSMPSKVMAEARPSARFVLPKQAFTASF